MYSVRLVRCLCFASDRVTGSLPLGVCVDSPASLRIAVAMAARNRGLGRIVPAMSDSSEENAKKISKFLPDIQLCGASNR
mgnify:CR=1 FL=1